MTIAFTCPACEHRLKVKDELAGRKVKCPACGGGAIVPAGEEEEETAAATKARPQRQVREEPEEDEERPRKKKKKKKQGNKGLVIGLVIGAVLLIGVVVLVIVLTRPQGLPNKAPADEPVAQQPPPKQNLGPQQPAVPLAPVQPPVDPRVTGFAGRGEDQAVMNDFRQIGIFYNQYLITNPRGPRDPKAFANEIRRDASHIAQALDKQIYVLLPGARRGANMVVAYDVPGNTANQHIVLMGDGSVQTLSRPDLQKLLPPQGKQ